MFCTVQKNFSDDFLVKIIDQSGFCSEVRQLAAHDRQAGANHTAVKMKRWFVRLKGESNGSTDDSRWPWTRLVGSTVKIGSARPVKLLRRRA
jgi:hypothetical protein